MSYTDDQDLQLVGRRVPDYSMETDANGVKQQVELPGHFEVGFMLDGAFRLLSSFPAAGLLADVERAKAAAADSSSAAPEASSP
jgi:hypothetical protein